MASNCGCEQLNPTLGCFQADFCEAPNELKAVQASRHADTPEGRLRSGDSKSRIRQRSRSTKRDAVATVEEDSIDLADLKPDVPDAPWNWTEPSTTSTRPVQIASPLLRRPSPPDTVEERTTCTSRDRTLLPALPGETVETDPGGGGFDLVKTAVSAHAHFRDGALDIEQGLPGREDQISSERILKCVSTCLKATRGTQLLMFEKFHHTCFSISSLSLV